MLRNVKLDVTSKKYSYTRGDIVLNGFLFDEQIDVDENNILRENPDLLNLLLKDRTTKKNIIWATRSYEPLGRGFEAVSNIRVDLITGDRVSLIRPRVEKAKYEQKKRTKGKAEVFTPTWIVKKQNDIADEDFKNLPLEEYVFKVWLEIACGEAPYMVSRYDTVTGEPIQIKDRVGFVDRKLERISEEINDEQEWFKYVCQAYQACYGYEFQGDSLLLARENLLYTFIDFYEAKFGKSPSTEQQKEIAKIISYNIFQMDGLKYTVPYTEKELESEEAIQLNLFGEPEELEEIELDLVLPGIPVKIKDWKANKMIEFQSVKRRNI